MTGALFYLLSQSIKNRLATRFRRLKQPKYLVGALCGILYFLYLAFSRFLFTWHGVYQNGVVDDPSSPSAQEALMFKQSVGALILFCVMFLAWVIPHERAALVFSEAEVAFLFPAPIDRRTLIHFKLFKSQLGILFTSLFFTLVFGWSRGGAPVWTRTVGWWIILSTLNLHFIGSSFARTILLDAGISNWKRRGISLALAAAVVAGVAVWAHKTVPPPPAVKDVSGIVDLKYYAEKVLASGPLVYLLYPFRIVDKPYLAPTVLEFLKALGPALLLLAVHYVWVVRSNVAFEEASIEASRKVAERVASMRAGKHPFSAGTKKRKRPPFKLAPTGLSSVGFLWKNLISAGSGFTLRFWIFMIWICVVVGIGTASSVHTVNFTTLVGPLSLALLGMSFSAGTKKRKRPPFKLAPTGLSSVGFLWKNLISAGSGFTLRFWIFMIWICVVVGIGTASSVHTVNFTTLVGPLSLALLGMSFFMGPQLVRQDFRQELPMADLLKTYPLPAWQVALGEILAPAAILTAVQWCLLVLATLMFPDFGDAKIPTDLRIAIAFAAAVLAPFMNLISLIIPNSAVLLFPGWFQTGRESPAGIEATGQKLIFAFGQFIVLALALVPAGLVFGIVVFAGNLLNSPVLAIPLAAIAGAVVMAVEVGFGVMMLGKLFDRFDISSESTAA